MATEEGMDMEFRPESLPCRSWSVELRWANIPLADPLPWPLALAFPGGCIQVAVSNGRWCTLCPVHLEALASVPLLPLRTWINGLLQPKLAGG